MKVTDDSVPLQKESFTYTGELSLFDHAINWKTYWVSQVSPWIGKNVLEVGAGLASNTPLMYQPDTERWVCIEPDPGQAKAMAKKLLPEKCECRVGTLDNVASEELFDTILYMDVLEHILNDTSEITKASKHLVLGGRIVVLAPAWPFLFSPFDREVGHFRRYTRSSLRQCGEASLKVCKADYLDSVGFFASAMNRYILGASKPTVDQIKLWDRTMVPLSRILDPILARNFGKSVLVVWEKEA